MVRPKPAALVSVGLTHRHEIYSRSRSDEETCIGEPGDGVLSAGRAHPVS
jgi:hypothetical protein